MARVRWLPKSEDDLDRLYDFIAEYNTEAAAKALRTLDRAANSLAEFPQKGHPWSAEDGFRDLVVPFGKRGYVIRYRLHDDEVIIVRVWHALEDR